MNEGTCAVCGDPLEGLRSDAKTHGGRCRATWNYRTRMASPEGRAKLLATKRTANARYRAKRPDAIRRAHDRDVASGAMAQRLRRRDRRERALRRIQRAERGTTGRIVWIAGRCSVCSDPFIHWSNGRTCSHEHSLRHKKAASVGRKRIRRTAIFERDAYRCGICGDDCDPLAKVPDPAAPTVDHILPRALGGSDDPENLQTAHFYCNCVKRDQIGFEFAA